MAEAGLRIRVDDRLRNDFIATCKANDMTAAQVLRAHMRLYIEEHGAEVRQGTLFGGLSVLPTSAHANEKERA